MLRDSVVVVVVVRTRPRAIPLAMITMRKSTHGFPFVSLKWIAYGAPLKLRYNLVYFQTWIRLNRLFSVYIYPEGPLSGAPYPYREIKQTHELIFSCYRGQRYFSWARTTAATTVESRNMAAIIQIIG